VAPFCIDDETITRCQLIKKEENLNARLILQIHDELIVEAPENEKTKAELIVKEEMENACKMKVLLKSDAHSGESWYDAKA